MHTSVSLSVEESADVALPSLLQRVDAAAAHSLCVGGRKRNGAHHRAEQADRDWPPHASVLSVCRHVRASLRRPTRPAEAACLAARLCARALVATVDATEAAEQALPVQQSRAQERAVATLGPQRVRVDCPAEWPQLLLALGDAVAAGAAACAVDAAVARAAVSEAVVARAASDAAAVVAAVAGADAPGSWAAAAERAKAAAERVFGEDLSGPLAVVSCASTVGCGAPRGGVT